MTVNDFLSAVRAIADSCPSYRKGGTGRDGTCDCIGLVMGAMYACGQPEYDMHGSNYFVRRQTDVLTPITSVSQLEAGMIVYKARRETDDLNARYLPGGSYYNGDTKDYYHAGVVESTQPLCIVHCTSTSSVDGIVRDSTVGSWSHCGYVKGLTREQQPAGTAIVTAPSGSTVNLRKRPEKHAPVMKRVAVGTRVAVSGTDNEWAKVTADGQTGYMKQEFLAMEEAQDPWVRLPLLSVRRVLELLQGYLPDENKEETV